MKTQTQTYYCPFLGHAISGVAARNCNNSSLDTYLCSHTGEACVAREGMMGFAEKLEHESADILPISHVSTERYLGEHDPVMLQLADAFPPGF